MASAREIVGKLVKRVRRLAAKRRAKQLIVCSLAAVVLGAGGWLMASASGGSQRAGAKKLSAAGPEPGPQGPAAPTPVRDSALGARKVAPGALATGQVAERSSLHGASASAGVASLERLVCENDIWRTQAQNDKRWQAAKMASLSRMIAELPAVRSATVIFDPGSPRKLGSSTIPPSAAVKVCLADRAEMTAELVAAIADLICGGIAGMDRRNVRIVDDMGFSYCADGARPAEASSIRLAEARLRAAEKEAAGKIRSLLDYIDGLVVAVNVDGPDQGDERISALIAVPRSHLAAVLEPQADPGNPARAQELAEPYLAKIHQSVMHLLGLSDPSAVKVDWYYDAHKQAPIAAAGDVDRATGQSASWLAANADVVGMALLGVCWVAALTGLLRKRLVARSARRCLRGDGRTDDLPADHQPDPRPDQNRTPPEPFDFVSAASVERLSSALAGESAQTIALVLTHLAPAKAAAVLATFEGRTQVEIAKRLAAKGLVDREVTSEVARELAARLADGEPAADGQRDGASKVADILHHAGYHTERMVLEALNSDLPELAESIRDRMFAFEDIAKLSADELRPAMSLIASDELAVALRTAGREVTKRIFSALSPSQARQIKQDTEAIGPVRLSDVEAAQRQVVDAIHRVRYGRYVSESQSVRADIQ